MTVTIDDVDIDDNGNSVGPELCCLVCRDLQLTRFARGSVPFTTGLFTGCCLDEIARLL